MRVPHPLPEEQNPCSYAYPSRQCPLQLGWMSACLQSARATWPYTGGAEEGQAITESSADQLGRRRHAAQELEDDGRIAGSNAFVKRELRAYVAAIAERRVSQQRVWD